LGSIAFHKFEVDLEKKFNDQALALARNYNITEIPWADLTRAVLTIYFVLTVLSMITRPDFLSLVIITLGMFALECPTYVSRRAFRMLVLMSLVTFVYDIIFLFFIRDVQAEDMEF